MWLYFCFIVVLCVTQCSSAISYTPISTGISVTTSVLPCQTVYYQWNLTPPSNRFSLTANATTSMLGTYATLSLTQYEPSTSNIQSVDCNLLSCDFSSGLGCEIDTCLEQNTTWYLWVSHGLTTTVDITVFVTVNDIPASSILNTNNVPVNSGGSNRYNLFDFYEIDITQAYALGTQIIISVVPSNVLYPKITLYLNNGSLPAFPESGCLSSPPSTSSITIPACALAKGGKYQVTVLRSDPLQEYQISAVVKVPLIVDISDTPLQYELTLGSDIVNFRYMRDAGSSVAVNLVIDNLWNGELQASATSKYLSYQSSCSTSKTCIAFDVGCHLRYEYCEVALTTASDPFYFSVVAGLFINPSEPITFTVRGETETVAATGVSLLVPSHTSLARGDLAHFSFPLSSIGSNDWLRIYAYLDASSRTAPVPEAILSISDDGNLAGPPGTACFYSSESCILRNSTGSIKSCSIQLDPCTLSNFDNTVYFSLYAEESQNYYYFEESTSFTIVTESISPPSTNILNVGGISANSVSASQYQIYRVPSVSTSVSITVSSNPRVQEFVNPIGTDLTVYIFYGATLSAPSCTCWSPTYQFNVPFGQEEFKLLTQCEVEALGQNGLYVVIGASGSYPGVVDDREFILSIAEEADASPISQSTLNIGETGVTATLSGGSSNVYSLNIPTGSLSSQTLVLTLRAHVESKISVYLTASTGTASACSTQNSIGSCTVQVSNGGFCTIVINSCDFLSPETRSFSATVNGYTGNLNSLGTYSMSVVLLDVSATAISFNSPIYDSLETSLYNHYSLSVPSGNNAFLIQAYVDATVPFFEQTKIELYVNSPNVPGLAGDVTDCLCFEEMVGNFTKVVYLKNPCEIVPGTYYFSIRTLTPDYDTTSIPYTLTVMQIPTEIETAVFDTVSDHSLYVNQLGTFTINVPSTFYNGLNDTQRIITVRVFTTALTDAVDVSISTSDPSLCGCSISLYTCSPAIGNDYCEIQLEYCEFGGAEQLYVSLVPVAGDPINPIPFSIEFLKYNIPGVKTLDVTTSSCATPPGVVNTFDYVNDLQIQYYELSYPSMSGDELVQIRVDNITGGQVTAFFSGTNLPTPSCNSYTSTACIDSCIVSASCSSGAKYFGIQAAASSANVPVAYHLTACITTISGISLNAAPTSSSLDANSLTSYQFMLNTFAISSNDLLVVQIQVTRQGTVGVVPTISMHFTQSTCTTCQNVFTKAINCNSNCSIVTTACELPLNYANTNWLLNLLNNDPANPVNYVVSINTYPLGTPQPLTLNQKDSISVPSFSWGILQYTPRISDLVPGQIMNSEIDFNITSGNRATSYVYAALDANAAACNTAQQQPSSNTFTLLSVSCCVDTTTRYVYIFNADYQNTLSFDVVPKLYIDSNTTVLSIVTNADGSISSTGTISVLAFDKSRFITIIGEAPPGPFYQQAVIPYSGSSGSGFSDVTIAVYASNSSANVAFYYGGNNFGGQGSCFNSVIASQSYPEAFQYFGCDATVDFNSPSNLYFGFKNSDPLDYNFYIDAEIRLPMTISSLGTSYQSLTGVAREIGVWTQFILDATIFPVTNRVLRISVSTSVEALEIAISKSGFAGTTGCLTSNYRGAATVSTTFIQDIALCPISSNTIYYLGISPSSKNTSLTATAFTVDLDLIDPDYQNQTVLTFGTTSGIPVAPAYYLTLETPSTQAPNGSLNYVSLSFSTLTEPQSLTVSYAADYTCDSVQAYNCVQNNTLCSAIIFPCYYLPSTFYHIFLDAPLQTTPFSVTATSNVVEPLFQAFPGPNSKHQFGGTIFSQSLLVYQITISGEDLLPGETIVFELTEVSCGSVTAYINPGYSAGPNCNPDPTVVPCTSAPCTLATLSPCNELITNILGDWYITVLGLEQLNYGQGTNIPAGFVLSVIRSGGVNKTEINPNELVTLYASLVGVDEPVCPAYTPLDITQCQGCVAPPGSVSNTYTFEPTLFVYSLDGAQFLGSEELTLTLASATASATINVQTDIPSFCSSSILPNNPVVYSCSALESTSPTCTIALDRCELIGFHQLYIWLNGVTFGTGTTNFNSTRDGTNIPVASLSLSQLTDPVFDIPYSSSSQWLLFTLAQGEIQFLRVEHSADYASIPDYLFTANLIRLSEGSVQFYPDWNMCNPNPLCTTTGYCKNSLNSSQCAENAVVTPCGCEFNRYTCQPDFVDGYSYFRIEAVSVSPTTQTVVGKLQIDFTVTRYPIISTCDNIVSGNIKHYIPTVLPGTEQIYHYNITHQSGQGSIELLISENALAIPNTCAVTTYVGVSGRSTSDLYFRQNSLNQIFLAVVGAGSTVGSTQYFLLREEAMNAYPVTLVNNTQTTVALSTVDNTTLCVVTKQTDYFKYTAAGSELLLVELFSTGATVYVNPTHVTYYYGTWECTTTSGYCKILIACNGVSGTYYFHIPLAPVDTTIRVTEYNTPKQKITLGTLYTISLDPYLPVSYEIANLNAALDPSFSLFVSTTGNDPDYEYWVTRGSFGDSSCEVDLYPTVVTDIIPAGPVIPNCRLLKTDDTYYINFMRTAPVTSTCSLTTIYLRLDLETRSIANSNASIASNKTTNALLSAYQTVRNIFGSLSLNQNSVIYVRVDEVLYGTIGSALVLKGPVVISNDPYVDPTDASGACDVCSSSLQNPNLAGWYDDCWHCSSIDTVYVDLTATDTYLQHTKMEYSISVTTSSWTALPSNSPVSFTLPGDIISYAFFSVTLPSDEGSEIEVYVTSGSIAKVDIYQRDCALRASTPIATVYCLLGADCGIITAASNYGNFTGDLRIVISGEDVQGTITATIGDDLCATPTASDAPFCVGSAGISYSAHDDSDSFLAKDSEAETLYNFLYNAFSNIATTGCNYKQLSDACLSDLKQFACQTALPECQSGYVLPPQYTTCVAIENDCGATFAAVLLPIYDCGHNYYDGGISFVSGGDSDIPVNSPSPPSPSNSVNALALGLGIGLGILALIIIIVVIVVLLNKGPSTADGSYSPGGAQ